MTHSARGPNQEPAHPQPLLVIVGPTGSGKTALAIALAQALGGEVVSADSRQIYRGCDIGTAKPSQQEQATAPHHLLDVCEPDERFSAGAWARQARTAILDIRRRAKLPIVCGGTGFYLRALLQPQSLAALPPSAEIRRRVAQETTQVASSLSGNLALWEQLQQRAPAAAARIHPNDRYRVARALEVAASSASPEPGTGTGTGTDADFPFLHEPNCTLGLLWPRGALHRRLNDRVEAMLADGFMHELHSLVDRWGEAAPALNSVGYAQMLPVLHNLRSHAQGVELWKAATRQYAKRQETWFRHQLPVTWLDASLPFPELCAHALARWRVALSPGPAPGPSP